MLEYKIKSSDKATQLQLIPYYDDSLYISDDLHTLCGVCDAKYELLDGLDIFLSNGSQTIRCAVKAYNKRREGYVKIKKSIKTYSFNYINNSNNEVKIHYIKYNGRYLFEDLSKYDNVPNGGEPLGTISFKGDNNYEIVDIDDNKEFSDFYERIYIEDGKFEYNGIVYADGVDFSLELTEQTQKINFEDGLVGEITVFNLENYYYVTHFCINIPMLSTLNVDDILQVKSIEYITIDNAFYEIFHENDNDMGYILMFNNETNTYDRIDNVSTDKNYFLLKDDVLCCKYKHLIRTTYKKDTSGDKLYIILKNAYPNLSGNIHYETINRYFGIITVDKIDDESFSLKINDNIYFSEKGHSFCIQTNDVTYDVEITNLTNNLPEVEGYVLGYININGAPTEVYVNNERTKWKRKIIKDFRIQWVEGDLIDIPTFIISNKKYKVYSEKFIAAYDSNEEVEVFYIQYDDILHGDIMITNALSDKSFISIPNNSFYIANNINNLKETILSQIQYIISNKNNLNFSVSNDIIKEPSINEFISKLGDTDISAEDSSQILYTQIGIYKSNDFQILPLNLGNEVSSNLIQEYAVTKDFYEEEKEKLINGIIDMEKEVYMPVIYNENIYSDEETPQNMDEVTEIEFNLHFRTRDMTTWKVNEDDGNDRTRYFKNWFCMDYPYYYRKDLHPEDSAENGDCGTLDMKFLDDKLPETEEEGYAKYNEIHDYLTSQDINIFETSDILGFLKFTDDDVFFQKSKLKKSFLRLSFYDSPDPKTQSLLYYSTIFINERDLFAKYLKNTKSKDGDVFTYTTNLGINQTDENMLLVVANESSGATKNSISVNTDYTPEAAKDKENLTYKGIVADDRETKRLSIRFNVQNRYQSDFSSDGYYLYIYKNFTIPFIPRSIYMKVEFNHAGLGRTIPFMYPRIFTIENSAELEHLTLTKAIESGENGKTYEVNPNDSSKVFEVIDDGEKCYNKERKILSRLISKDEICKFVKGYELQDTFYQQYIELKVLYDDIRKRFVYYNPVSVGSNDKTDNVSYRNGKMIFNLWELKIKNDKLND